MYEKPNIADTSINITLVITTDIVVFFELTIRSDNNKAVLNMTTKAKTISVLTGGTRIINTITMIQSTAGRKRYCNFILRPL